MVINWYDNASSGWNPIPVSATIAFRGVQVSESSRIAIKMFTKLPLRLDTLSQLGSPPFGGMRLLRVSEKTSNYKQIVLNLETHKIVFKYLTILSFWRRS